ncbi:P-loop NTPase [Pontibacillus yanchengensis]|uniref:P-loop NTPase n=2 Tax=Pontibacillus yanchengensis TaxID=462910 RepID=A0ACC7VC99_9BACI|nr:P-loop NTPase [Pontibacillus yanchengensis]MYL52327.1 P-loop NTPase [Pontibacillus yanchengensis]
MFSGEVIAITSGKGGVGKSTVSVNLALALKKLGKKVAIVDLDIYGFSVPKLLGISARPKTINERIIPVEAHGVKVMSMGFLIKGNEPVVWRGPMLGKMVNHFWSDVQWGELDYMILDLPPGTGDVALDMHQLIPQSKEIIVTTPHEAATHVAERAGSMAIKTDHEIIGVVENMAFFTPPGTKDQYFLFGKGGGETLADTLNTELISSLPIEPPYPDGTTPVLYEEGTVLHDYFLSLAKNVLVKTNQTSRV